MPHDEIVPLGDHMNKFNSTNVPVPARIQVAGNPGIEECRTQREGSTAVSVRSRFFCKTEN